MPNPGKISPDLIGTCPWFEDRAVEAANMGELMSADPKRVMDALLTMGRIDIAALREAGSGG